MTRLHVSRRAVGLGLAGVVAAGVAVAVPNAAHAADPCGAGYYCLYTDANYITEGVEGSGKVTDSPVDATIHSLINDTGLTITLHDGSSSMVIPPATTKNHFSFYTTTFSAS